MWMRIRFRTSPTVVTFNTMTSNVQYPQVLDTAGTMLMPELARQVDPAEIKVHISNIHSAFGDFCEDDTSGTVEQQEEDTIVVDEIRRLALAINSRGKVSGWLRGKARTRILSIKPHIFF